MQNEKSPNFSKLRPNFAPNFALKFSPEILCFVFWETETTKNSPKIPAIFQCQIPRQSDRKNSQKVFWGASKLTILPWIGDVFALT